MRLMTSVPLALPLRINRAAEDFSVPGLALAGAGGLPSEGFVYARLNFINPVIIGFCLLGFLEKL